jgi:hypothetical protein
MLVGSERTWNVACREGQKFGTLLIWINALCAEAIYKNRQNNTAGTYSCPSRTNRGSETRPPAVNALELPGRLRLAAVARRGRRSSNSCRRAHDKREVQVPILPWQTQHGRARKRFGAIHHLSCHYYGDAWISARWGQVRFSQIVKIEEAPEGAERVT